MSLPNLPRWLRWTAGSVAVLVLLAAVLAGAYAFDRRGEETTLRGLTIEGHPAGDMTRMELSRVLSRIDGEVATRQIEIALPSGTETFLAVDLGVSLDRDAVAARALEAGKGSSAWQRFRAWLGSFTRTRPVGIQLAYDTDRASEVLGSLDGIVVTSPTEPRLVLDPDLRLTIREGEAGTIVDVDAVVDRLGHQVEAGGPFAVDAPTRPLPPRVDDEEVAAVAEELNELTADGLEVRVGDEVRRLGAHGLRLRIDLNDHEGSPAPRFDLQSLQGYLESVFAEVELGGDDPVFEIVDDEPVVVEEGTPPSDCCRDDAAEIVADAILSGRTGPITVDAETTEDDRLLAWARGEGVAEKVAEFTTDHQCCEGRVDNIQRFADLVRGVYLTPGETLSLNEHVGQRTSDKGFVPAGTIVRGHLVPTVGGGVSQFATTIFNAAFFAGFDFVTYQSHSLYISRYPYGREATISWPAPDLEIENSTDYPALIWTSYTDTSVTVSIYSTKSVEVEEVRQETSPARACTRVDTYRLRTYEDGTELEDSVFATYRPSEGFDCNGNPTDRPNL